MLILELNIQKKVLLKKIFQSIFNTKRPIQIKSKKQEVKILLNYI